MTATSCCWLQQLIAITVNNSYQLVAIYQLVALEQERLTLLLVFQCFLLQDGIRRGVAGAGAVGAGRWNRREHRKETSDRLLPEISDMLHGSQPSSSLRPGSQPKLHRQSLSTLAQHRRVSAFLGGF